MQVINVGGVIFDNTWLMSPTAKFRFMSIFSAIRYLVECLFQVFLLRVLFSFYVNDTVLMLLMYMCRFISYVFIYASVEIFSKVFN